MSKKTKKNKKVKTLRLGYGKVSLAYDSSGDKLPEITIGEFIDKSKKRTVSDDCRGDESIPLLRLQFPNMDSIKVLRKYLNLVEDFMHREEDFLCMYTDLEAILDSIE